MYSLDLGFVKIYTLFLEIGCNEIKKVVINICQSVEESPSKDTSGYSQKLMANCWHSHARQKNNLEGLAHFFRTTSRKKFSAVKESIMQIIFC